MIFSFHQYVSQWTYARSPRQARGNNWRKQALSMKSMNSKYQTLSMKSNRWQEVNVKQREEKLVRIKHKNN